MSHYRKCADPAIGHRFGGWRPDRTTGRASRRCRRCGAVQRTKLLADMGLRVRGGRLIPNQVVAA